MDRGSSALAVIHLSLIALALIEMWFATPFYFRVATSVILGGFGAMWLIVLHYGLSQP